jgi:hypothetical protein
MNVRHASIPQETQEGPPQLAPRRDFVAGGLGFARPSLAPTPDA